MILTKEIEVKIGKYGKYYSNLGYDISQKKIIVKIEDLKSASHLRVDVMCDVCGCCKNIIYQGYVINIKKYNIYTCNKCFHMKSRKKIREASSQ